MKVPSQLLRSSDLRTGNLPAAAQHQDVHAAVIVVIGLNHVEPAELVARPACAAAIRERAVAVVVKVVQRRAHVVARGDDVQQAVVIEVVHDHSAGHGKEIQPGCGSHVDETADVLLGFKFRGRDQILRGHA